jgi:hypothetical protein
VQLGRPSIPSRSGASALDCRPNCTVWQLDRVTFGLLGCRRAPAPRSGSRHNSFPFLHENSSLSSAASLRTYWPDTCSGSGGGVQRNRSSSAGRRRAAAPGPSSPVTKCPTPRTRTAGTRFALLRVRSPAAAIWVAASSVPFASRRPSQSSSGAIPAHPIATSVWPSRQARPKLSETMIPTVASVADRISSRMRRADASGSSGRSAAAPGSGRLDLSMPAFAQTNPCPLRAKRHPAPNPD